MKTTSTASGFPADMMKISLTPDDASKIMNGAYNRCIKRKPLTLNKVTTFWGADPTGGNSIIPTSANAEGMRALNPRIHCQPPNISIPNKP